jgi:diguanylate cyclase
VIGLRRPSRQITDEANELSHATLEALAGPDCGFVASDADGCVRVCSADAHALLGPLIGLDGADVDRLLLAHGMASGEDQPGPFASALAGDHSAPFSATLTPPGDDQTDLLVSAGPILTPDGRRVGALMKLCRPGPAGGEALAFGLHDPLTGLANRTLLADRMGQAIARMGRGGSPFALLMIDLDGFKLVNDEHGHDCGDRLLHEVGDRLAHAVRLNDTVARIGGDEFVAICEAPGSETDLAALAARLGNAVAAPVQIGSFEVGVGASIGVTVADVDATPGSLLHEADLAMYEAKRVGRNGWVRFDESLARDSHRQAHLATELRAAVEARDIGLAFQPELDLQRGPILGYEALVRWGHPDLGAIDSAELIRVAEGSDLIIALGALILDQACLQAASWTEREGRRPWLSVNISPRELADSQFADRVLQTLERRGLPASQLFLELPASGLFAAGTADGRFDVLHAAGVGLCIDDFGSGSASLTSLQGLPVTQLKIDGGFVRGLPGRREDDVVVTSIINLAHNLDITVVAKGIETDAQAARLRGLGCDIGQGFLLGRPVSADRLPGSNLIPAGVSIHADVSG